MEGTDYRKGDKVSIPGSYQYSAINSGNIFQRNWHILKLQTAVDVAGLNDDDTVLDIGSGSGMLTNFFSKGIKNYIGVDANEDAIRFAQLKYGNDRTFFKLLQIDDLNLLSNGNFSRIFLLETIEHITERQAQKTLENIYQLLKKEGLAIITTPNRKSLWPLIEWLLDFLRLTPRLKNEQHEKLYSIPELSAISVDAGFKIKMIKTINGLAPWFSFLGNKATRRIHDWEMNKRWIPGSLIIMVLQKDA